MSHSTRSEIRGSRKAEALGILAGWGMKLWSCTLRFEIDDRCGVTTPGNQAAPVIFALWHNRIFTLPPIWWKTGGNGRKSVVLTSASKDGAILSRAMAVFGLGAVRGSSSRRAVAALIGMKRALKDGFDICITPDGPRGPRHSFHPGVIKLAESSGAPIVPIHASYSSAWRLKTWDRLVIPKPFSRVRVIFDEMLVVPPKLGEAAFETCRERLQAILLAGADDA
ncbi:MAG: lysophospholipid acyltransferase family protein [Akkermansiaceae bacterium]